MEGATEQYRPQDEGYTHDVTGTTEAHHEQPQFTNSFAPGQTEAHYEEPLDGRERSGSKDFSHTDEWDASKVPPSRFQQRKGSIYSTQGSRDGHVQKNNERDKDFHEKHHKLFGKVKEKAKEVTGASHRRKSSSGSKTD
ncbi:hypothetical protein G7054_g11605 [Neopestalotiopsis clavispora]|nr:hypothetical protein E8E14_015022 [Neopestalotiopsis sp. 37M]KAF7523885.1 hypothetical protein G7054_g11605 [Neopestalotiopsis clavispora]